MKHTKLGCSRKGDLAEYYAVTWLWDKGYEVFKNCGCTGAIDLIAIDKQGSVTLIDVKTARESSAHNFTKTGVRTPLQKEKNVRFLLYNPVSRKLRFVQHKEVENNE